jgi:hypothetical protein
MWLPAWPSASGRPVADHYESRSIQAGLGDGRDVQKAGFRGRSRLLAAFTRVAARTLAPSPISDRLPGGFRHFVASMPAPVASGWSGCRAGFAPAGEAPPFHGARGKRSLPPNENAADHRASSACAYGPANRRINTSSAGHGGPLRRVLTSSRATRGPFGNWSPASQRHAATIARTRTRHSSSSS